MNNNIKRGVWVAVVLLGGLGLAVSAQGASFDCGKAGTMVERLICDNPYISELDDKLSVAFKAALKSEQQANVIRAAQRDWLPSSQRCDTAWCLLTSYEDRLKALGVRNIYPDRTNKSSKRERYFIMHEVEFIENQSESRPFCRAVLDALINTKTTTKLSEGCTDVEILKLPGVSDPPWEKLDFVQHEELAKKILTLSRVGSDEYFRKQKHSPERYPTPEQQQRRLENIKQLGAELFMLRLPTEYYGDLVLVTLRFRSMDCVKVSVNIGEASYGAWVTPDLKEIARDSTVFNPHAGRPLLYRGRLYLVRAGSDVDIGTLVRAQVVGSACDITSIID